MNNIMTFEDLIDKAKSINGERQIARNVWAGAVSSALVTDRGNVYTGVCIDVLCGIGFCAEHSAIAAMVSAGENKIEKIVAVKGDRVVSPCGRCREFIAQVHDDNMDTLVMVPDGRVLPVRELLPVHWEEPRQSESH